MPHSFAPTLLLLFLGLQVVRAAPAAATAADDLKLWPVQIEYVPCARKTPGTNVLAWTPPGAKRVRALLIIIANTDSKHFGEHAATRKVAQRQEMGIVYLRCGAVIDNLAEVDPAKKKTLIQGVLDAVADETGIEEFRYAPWIPLGKSSMGRFPFWMAWAYPQRTIAAITYHGETPTWPPADWARLGGESILYVTVNGEIEWGGTWNRHVRPSLLNYRAHKGWLPHQVVVHDVGHGNYVDVHGSPGWGKPFPDHVTVIQVWDYLAMFLDKAIGARVPAGVYPTKGPVRLAQLDVASGYLVDRFAIERLFEMPPHRLKKTGGQYEVDPTGDEPVPGYAAIEPAEGFRPPRGVPVVPLELGTTPAQWLITEAMDFAMRDDPMRSLGDLQALRPKPGDTVTVDDHRTTFSPIDPKYVRRGGGIDLGAMQRRGNLSLLAYTVVDVPSIQHVKLNAPFTENGRVQVVLAGQPVAHRQVVKLEKGLYPMLVVVRLRTHWKSLNAGFEPASDAEIAKARQVAAENQRQKPETEQPSQQQEKRPLIQRAAEASETQRENSFWIIDRELVDAWLKLHDVRGVADRQTQ